MPPRPDLTSFPLGARVQDPFLVQSVAARTGESGPFSILTLGNASGVIATAPFWVADQHRIAGIATGDVVQVIGEVASYRDRRQLAVSSIRVLPPETVEWSTLLPSLGPIEPMWQVVDRWLPRIEPRRLRSAAEAFYLDSLFRDRMSRCPAALDGPQAALGGLLTHTVEVAAVARTLGRLVSADQDLTLVGALLHDIGKLEAYEWDQGFRWSDGGRSLGPAVLGTEMVARRLGAGSHPILGHNEVRELQHIMLAVGDTIPGRSLSAHAVRLADQACTAGVLGAIAMDDAGIGLFGPKQQPIETP